MMVLFDVALALFLWWLIAFFLSRFEHYSAPPCSWDLQILSHVFKCRNLWLDRIFILIALLGSMLVLTPIAALISWNLATAGQIESACLLASSLFGAALIANLSKRVFKRKRPAVFPAIGKHFLDPSFPSAHSAQIVAFMLPLCLILIPVETQHAVWISGAALAIAGMVTFSRIYLQVHYPSDVFAGITLALIWVTSVNLLLDSFRIQIA